MMDTYDLEDVFRAQNPDKMSFTFSRGDSKFRYIFFLHQSLDGAVLNPHLSIIFPLVTMLSLI